MLVPCAAGVIAMTLITGACTTPPAGSSPAETGITQVKEKPLFIPLAPQPAASSTALRDKQVTRWRPVKIDYSLLAAAPQTITLNLFDDVKFIAQADQVERTERGVTWVGKLQGMPNSHVTLIVNDDVVSGNITTPKERYHVRFAGNGVHEVQLIDQSRFKND